MVFGIFLMTAMVPTIIGVNEASKGTRDHEERRRESARQQRCHLLVQCMPLDGSSQQRSAIHNAKVYLGADKKACQFPYDRLTCIFPLTYRPPQIESGL
jgi:hypothetical protein